MTKTNDKKIKKVKEYDGRSDNQRENDRLMEEFLAKGGKVEVIPAGISGAEYYGVSATNWKKKSKKSY